MPGLAPGQYSTTDDLLLGNIPLPSYASGEKYVADAADEINSTLGFLYETPIDMDENGPVAKPVRLTLKRISNWLATGRLILAISAGGEQRELHAYGASLVEQATIALQKIATGEIPLEGVEKVESGKQQFAGPQIFNVDKESNVEAFYDRVANPRYFYMADDAEPRGMIR